MKYEYYDRYINKNTKGRYDVTPIFNEPEVLIPSTLSILNCNLFLVINQIKYYLYIGTNDDLKIN